MNTQSFQAVQQTPIGRRKFLQVWLGFSIVATVAGIVAPIIAYVWPMRRNIAYAGPVDVGKIEDFPLNSGTIVAVDDKPVIIVNTKNGGLKAYSAICTHLGCIVYWHREKGVMHSPCHDGLFSPVTGAVISGPPPRPLPPYELAVREGRVFIGKPLGQIYGT